MKNKFSEKYKRENHPLILRFIAIWRVLTCRNFIFIDYYEFERGCEKGRNIRSLYRTDYDKDSELKTLEAAHYQKIKKDA
jgi:hypothetical protein